MTNSKQIAGLVGPTIVVLTISEVLNFHIWAVNIPPTTYLNGTLLFIAGLAIVRAHNYWTLGWPVLVTLVGWFGILGGLFRMFAPEAQQASESISTYIVIAALGVVGVFLTFKAYWKDRNKTVAR